MNDRDKKWWTYLRALLRRGWARFPERYKALNSAKVERGRYLCASCNKIYRNKEVSVDHITPCGSLQSWDDIAPFIERMFCPAEDLQVLCHPCHKRKTLRDRGYTDEDIEIAGFKRLKAYEQRAILNRHGLVPESNALKRVEQYAELVRNGKNQPRRLT